MRFLDEIRDNSGYYYIDDKLNLNDFVLMIAYAMIMLALWVVYLVYPGKNDFAGFDIVMQLLIVGFSTPFMAHFFGRTVKFIDFKLKKHKILTKGMPYRGIVIDSKKGKILFKDSITRKKLYSYYPVIKVYIRGEEHILTSRIPMNNFHENGLKDKNVIAFVYKGEFIMTDFSPTDDDVLNLEYIDARYKYKYNKYKEFEYMWLTTVAAAVALLHAVLMGIKLFLNYIV